MSMNVANSSTYLNPGSNDQRYRSQSEEGLISPRNNAVKKFKILSAVLGVATLALIIALAVVASKKSSPAASPKSSSTEPPATTTTTKPPEYKVCYRPECRDAAARFLTIMNTDADPCNNFFDFMCGKWANETRMPKEKSRYGVFDGMRDALASTCIESLESSDSKENDGQRSAVSNAKVLYQACVNSENIDSENGVEQLRGLLMNVSISSNFTSNKTEFEIYNVLASITKKYGLNFIINFAVGPDDKNTSSNIITLDQPDTFGLARNFLLGNESNPRVEAYKAYIKEALCLLSPNRSDCSYLEDIVQEIFHFEYNVAKRTRDLVERRSAWTWYFKKSFEELNTTVPHIDFLTYSKAILGSQGDGINLQTNVIVKEETFFANVSEYLLSTNKSVQSNYLAWRLVQHFGPYLFKDFRTIKFKFDQVNEGIQKQQDIRSICFDKTNEYFGHAVGRMYVDAAFSDESKVDVDNMVGHLADAFRKLLDNNKWMDDVTKEKSREKLTKMVSMMGYPDWIKDDAELNAYYNVSSMEKDDLPYNLATIMSFTAERSFSILNKTNNRSADWVTQASIVNAFYNPSANSITFPAGILQLPFYGKRPRYLNYGAIGYVIGHEITHGYDDQGSEFDGDGNLFDWWTNETRAKFDEGKQCFIDQYTNIVDPMTGRHLNGSQTIGENIADNGGIREAYQAYLLHGREEERLPGLEMYSDLQMFFMSAASDWCTISTKEGMENSINDDVHAPGMYRAYVPLSNTDEFAELFKCPVGSQMNPAKKCTLW